MRKNAQIVTFSIVAAASIIFGMVLAGGAKWTPSSLAESEAAPAAGRAVSPTGGGNAPIHVTIPSFADIAERVNPAVVSITSTEMVDPGQKVPFHSPFEFFFGPDNRRRQQRAPEEPRREDSGGSGFIISEEGFILTNNHVIEGADKIRVRLTGDDEDYPAEVVGADPSTDLALIKISVSHKLPTVPLGDSDALRVGDWVIAVGNPYFYEHTVTVGVVSAKGRKLRELSRDFSLDDFIQTDAAVNCGNSGGPLVNAAGEVVGVNSAISSVGQGIGFSVPINTAKSILQQLKTAGHVSRGYLGIRLSNVTPDYKEAFGLKSSKGALVQQVEKGLPADKAGIRPGDVIVGVEGKPVGTTDELVKIISSREPGSRVRLNLIRDGHDEVAMARLSDRGEYLNPAKGKGQPGQSDEGDDQDQGDKRLGITVENLTPDIRRQLDLEDGVIGVVVTDVSQTSEAFEQGITRGNVIVSVNRVPVSNVNEYRREMGKIKTGSKVLFRVINASNDTSRFVVITATEE